MKFLSWLDVKDNIRKETDNFRHLPDGIINLHFYPDEIVVEQKDEDKNLLKEAFKTWFPNPDVYDPVKNQIYLDIARFPIIITCETGSNDRMNFLERPRFDNLYFSRTFLSNETLNNMSEPEHKIIAFHSFKGGVGRTLLLAAMIKSLSEIVKEQGKEKRILVIDGDIEAPGVTFWEKNRIGGAADIGFTQFLNAIQYANSDSDYNLDAVIDYFAQEIRRYEQVVDSIKIYVLPAFNDPLDLFQINVRPEHVSQDDNPWKLRDCVDRLATRINADYVFIDLRAGISELSAPFLLDPYIDRFLVTTLSEQSLYGTELILREMTKINKIENKVNKNFLPEVIFSMVPEHDEKRLLDAQTRFDQAIFGPENENVQEMDSDEELLSDPIPIRVAHFKSELLGIRSWEDVWENAGSIIDIFNNYFSGLEELRDDIESIIPDEDEDGVNRLKKLKTFCSEYVFAETTTKDSFLKTGFFKEFPRQNFNSLPLVVSLGAKGSGKTFHFMRMTGFKTYQSFCDKIEPGKVKIDADFFPILRSSEIFGESEVIQQLKLHQPLFDRFDHDAFKIQIEKFRDENHSESDWKDFWENMIIQAISENNLDIKNYRQLDTLVNKPIILLMDGLENLFPDIHSDINQQNAISALLDIPGRLSEIRDRHIGLVIFLRKDYLGSAKKQNSGQFEKKYENYKLLWDKTAFLRLVYWLATTSGALEKDIKADPSSMNKEPLSQKLRPLWGLKLGNDNSREANTINWVYGALSDFKGYLQARDVVRFLEEAANASDTHTTSQWKDRLIPPTAIRRAMEGCSLERVKELKQESKIFKKWVDSLQAADELVMPFSKSLLPDDSSSSLLELKKLGVVYEDISDTTEEFRFYIPEIYRLGLGFKFKTGARPKVLSLKRKAIGKDFM